MSEQQITIEKACEDMLACAAFLAGNVRSSDGHAEALKEIVPRYLEQSEVDVAAELADSIEDPFTRDRLLIQVAEKCAAIDDDEYAFQLVESIEDTGAQAQARERIAVQKSVKGDFAKALEIADTLPHADFVYAEIAARQNIAGDESAALRTVERIDFANARVAAFQNIALLDLQKGKTMKASPMLDKAVETAGEIEFAEEKIRAFCEIANLFVEAGDKGKAIETFDRAKTAAEMLDNVHRDAFLAIVAHGFLQAGSLELADRTLDLVADKTQIATALLGFAREFWRKGEADEARETLEESYAILKSQRDDEIRDSRARFTLFAAIAVEYAQTGRNERALEIAQEIPDENSQTNALQQIAQVCALQNKDELARQTVNAIGDDAQKMFTLIAVSDVKNNAEDKTAALALLREAETLAETVPQLASRSAALNELAARFNSYGDAEKARRLLHENLETIAQIRDESSRAAALAQLSDFYRRFGFDLDDAEKRILQSLIERSML